MSKKVVKYLIADLILMAIVTGIGLWLSHICPSFFGEYGGFMLRFVISCFWIVFDLVMVFFFLLYWWSDVKWTHIKIKGRKMFKKEGAEEWKKW